MDATAGDRHGERCAALHQHVGGYRNDGRNDVSSMEQPSAAARRGFPAQAWAALRANPGPVVSTAADAATWLVALWAGASFLLGQSWATDLGAMIVSAGGEGGVGAAFNAIGSALAGATTAWRGVTAPLAGLLEPTLGGWTQTAIDAGVVLLANAFAATRALAATARLRSLRSMITERGMAGYLRRRLDAVYNTDPRLTQRAKDQSVVARDAELLASWCAKFMSFQSDDREADEAELDKGWLRRTIVLNVDLQFPELPAHQSTAAKGWVSELVVAELTKLGETVRRVARKGPARLRRAGRNAGVVTISLAAATVAELIYRAIG